MLMTGPWHWETCPDCNGKGYDIVPDNGTNYGEEVCVVCNGEGRILLDEFGEPDLTEPSQNPHIPQFG